MPLQFTEEDFEPKAGLFKEEDFAPKKETGPGVLSQIAQSFRPSSIWHNAIERPATGIYNALGEGFINTPTAYYKIATGQPLEERILGVEGMHSTLPFKPIKTGQPLLDVQIPDAEVNPISAAVGELAGGLTTPGNLAALPVAGGEQAVAKLLRVLFGGQMAEGAVIGGQQALDPNLTPFERQKGAVSGLLASAGGYGIGHSLMPKGPQPSGFPASAIPDLRFEELGIPLPEYLRSSVEPNRPFERSQLVRESQGPTPILEPPISIPRREVLIYDRSRPIEQPVVPVKPPVEEAGGKVSFAAPAEAGGVPSAGQSAKGKSVVGEQEALMQGQFVPRSEVGRGTAPYGKGLQTKAGLEKGQKRRRETGGIFPTGEEGRPLQPYDKTKISDVTFMGKVGRANWPHGMWLDKAGKLFEAGGHYESAADYLGERKFDWKKAEEEGAFEDSLDYVFQTMEQKGFAQIRGTPDGLEVMTSHLSQTQKAALERWGIENNKSVLDKQGNIIYEPPKGTKAEIDLDAIDPRSKGKGLGTRAALEKGRARRGETGAINPSGEEGRLTKLRPSQGSEVYHQTPYNFDPTQLKPWSHVGTKESAQVVWDQFKKDVYEGKEKPDVRLHKYELDVKNPLRVEDAADGGDSAAWAFYAAQKLKEQGHKVPRFPDEVNMISALKEAGYDSLVYKNTAEIGGDSYIILDKSQVKYKPEVESKGLQTKLKPGQGSQSGSGVNPLALTIEKFKKKLLDEHGPASAQFVETNLKKQGQALPAVDYTIKNQGAHVSRAGDWVIFRLPSVEKAKKLWDDYIDFGASEGQKQLSGSDVKVTVKSLLEMHGIDTEGFDLRAIKFPEGEISRKAQEISAKTRYQESEGFYAKDRNKLFDDLLAFDESVRNYKAPSESKGLQTKLKPNQGSQSGAGLPLYTLAKDAGTKAKAVAVKLKDYFKGAEDKVLPMLDLKTDTHLFDFQPKEISNQIAAKPFASEVVPVLGRLLGGNARIRTPQDASVASWFLERNEIGPAAASLTGELNRGKLDPLFPIDKEGNLNVKGKPGQTLKEDEVFVKLLTDPFAYDMTIPQRRLFNREIKPQFERMLDLAEKYKIVDDVFDSGRAFTSRASEAGKIEQSLEKRIVARVNHLYRAIATKRLADDPVLGAQSKAQKRAELRQTYAVDLATGKMTEKEYKRIVDDTLKKGYIDKPNLRHLFFPPEVAKLLNKEFAAESSSIRRGLATANSTLKSSTLGYDLGGGQIQLLGRLIRTPRLWGVATVESLRSMFNPERFAAYLNLPENKTTAIQMAQLGSQVGRLPEFMSGLGESGLLGKWKYAGIPSRAFGRQFQTILDVAKLEMFKALKGKYKTSEWPNLLKSIESGGLSSRSSGVRHNRALLERILFLAPAYYRGALDVVAGLAQKGVTRHESVKNISSFVVGGAALYYAVGKFLLNMDDDEIVKRMDPSRTDFMTWSVKNGAKAPTNIGFGGIFRSVLRLLGNVWAAGRKSPKSLVDDEVENNIITKHLNRFYRAHSGPVVRMNLDYWTGEDYMGRKTTIPGVVVKSNLPLLAQTAIGNEDQEPAAAAEYGAGLAGLTAFPESYTARRTREGSALAKQRFGKDYDRLGLNQRLNVETALDKKFAGVPRGISESKARDLALKRTDERIAKLQKDIGPEMNAWMKENKLKLRGYQVTFDIGGTALRLMSGEAEHLHNLTVKNYKQMYETLKDNPDFKKLDQQQKQEVFDDFLQSARDTAKPYILKGIADLE